MKHQKRTCVQKSLLKKISCFLILVFAAITSYAHYPGLALAPASKEIDYKSLVFNGEYAAYYQGNDIVVIKADSFDPKHTLINSPSSRQRISKLFLCGSTLVSLTDKNLITYDLSDNISEKNFPQKLLKIKHPFDTSNPLLEIWDDYILGLNHDLNALVGIRFRNFDKSKETEFKIPFSNEHFEQVHIKNLCIHGDFAYLFGPGMVILDLKQKNVKKNLLTFKQSNPELLWMSSEYIYYTLSTKDKIKLMRVKLSDFKEYPFSKTSRLPQSCSLLYSDERYAIFGRNNHLHIVDLAFFNIKEISFPEKVSFKHQATQTNHCLTFYNNCLYLFLNMQNNPTYVIHLDKLYSKMTHLTPDASCYAFANLVDFCTVHLVRSEDKILRVLDIGNGLYLPCLSPAYPKSRVISGLFRESRTECYTANYLSWYAKNFDYYMLYLSQPNLTDNPYWYFEDDLNQLTSTLEKQLNDAHKERKDIEDLTNPSINFSFKENIAFSLVRLISESTIHSAYLDAFHRTKEGKDLQKFFNQEQIRHIEKIAKECYQDIRVSHALLTLLAQSAIQDKPSAIFDILTRIRTYRPNYLLFQAIVDRMIKKERLNFDS